MMKYEVRATPFEYDMSAWCCEKAENTVRSLVLTVKQVKALDIDEVVKQALLNNLQYAIYNASKILAFSAGADWENSDPQCLFDEGNIGLEKVLLRYDLLSKSKLRPTILEKPELIRRITNLLLEPKESARTSLHELFSSISNSSPMLEKLKDELERVTFGEATWDTFLKKADTLVEVYKNEGDS